ncbi:hypothetical protein GQ44DRAFT_717615 [Phaeosphaeriaceae sp. PMI808]|nr:hypothetical protein GQ44DRAFT_717615 [Phaeosphaeriaceae sp. PMI808]
MDSPFENARGSTSCPAYTFARFIPTNRSARSVIERTRSAGSRHHASFVGTTPFRDQETPCFELSLHNLPSFKMKIPLSS